MDEGDRPRPPPGDRGLVVQLQDVLLPSGVPVVPGAHLAARYLLADDAASAGGDWFDAVPLGDGRVVLCVGDVVGHGVEAAVTMGELRAVFGERLRDQGDLRTALLALHRSAARAPAARAATVCAALLDTRTGELEYCTAGHPPPVVLAPDGRGAYLPTTGAGPLGVGEGLPTQVHRLDEGEILLLYSDGLVERPGRTAGQSTLDLLRVAEAAAAPPSGVEPVVDRLCRQLLEGMTGATGYADDITVLALQRVAPLGPLRLAVAAVPDSVRTVRIDLDDWLSRLHVSVLDEVALLHAVGELVANAVEHAYGSGDPRREVRVTAGLGADGIVRVEVADDGRWRRTGGAVARGRGLAMVRGLVDGLDVERGDDGTRVRVRHEVRHPAGLLRSRGRSRPIARRDLQVTVDGRTVRTVGDVDREGAERLRVAIVRSSRGGLVPLTIDLGGVSLLSSAGVRVLVDATEAGEVRLLAPAGSAAQHVLELVRLPYVG